jgi:hypothetical protein
MDNEEVQKNLETLKQGFEVKKEGDKNDKIEIEYLGMKFHASLKEKEALDKFFGR